MASEITVEAKLTYLDDDGVFAELEQIADVISAGAEKVVQHRLPITHTAEVAIDLGGISSLGWFIGKNMNGTNFLQLRTATAGVAFAKLLAGEIALFRFGTGITAPFAIADTGTCDLWYILVSG